MRLVSPARGLVHPQENGYVGRSPRIVCEFGGRLTSDPNRSSLGLLPSGPDPVGEWLVHCQPPGLYIGRYGPKGKDGPVCYPDLSLNPGFHGAISIYSCPCKADNFAARRQSLWVQSGFVRRSSRLASG